jgi:hypothetical protein
MLFTRAVRGSWTECKSDCDGLRHGGSSFESAPGIRLSGRCANPERPRSGNDGARAKRREFVVGCPPGDGFRADVQQTRQLARRERIAGHDGKFTHGWEQRNLPPRSVSFPI